MIQNNPSVQHFIVPLQSEVWLLTFNFLLADKAKKRSYNRVVRTSSAQVVVYADHLAFISSDQHNTTQLHTVALIKS